MNNVTNFFGDTAGPLAPIREAGFGEADFGIHTFAAGYSRIPDTVSWQDYDDNEAVFIPAHNQKYYIARADNGMTLGDPKSLQYRPVAPRELIGKMRDIIERSSLNLDGITENIQISHNGERTFVEYDLPNNTYPTPDGDTASLQLLGTTSFDSTFPFTISAGALQKACLNKQIFTSGNVAVYQSHHVKSLDIDYAANRIQSALGIFEKETKLWKRYAETPCDRFTAFKMLISVINWGAGKAALKAYPEATEADINRIYFDAIKVRRSNGFDHAWKKFDKHYTRKFGHNYWAVYNALTDWSTHFGTTRLTGRKVSPNFKSSQVGREKKIVEAFKNINQSLAA